MSARRAFADGPAIRTEGLVRRFGENVAVDGVDLEVAPGEIYGFLGSNGAGKTTTVRMLVTLLAPTAGRAWVAGSDVVSDPGAGAVVTRDVQAGTVVVGNPARPRD